MDPNSSLGKICLEDDVIVILSNKVEGSGDWNSLEYQNTAGSKGKKVMNVLSFYKMETDKVSERYIPPCFVNGLEAYDGEINLAFDENLILNEDEVKLCLDYEVKKGQKLVKKDDVEPRVILRRSFMRLDKGIVDFDSRVITIYLESDPFEDGYEKTEKSLDDWDRLLDSNFNDIPKFGEELPLLVCKIGKSNHNKKRSMENLSLFYQDIGPSLSAGDHLTQEEAAKEALATRISQKFTLLEEIVKEEEEAVKRIKGEALKEKDDPGAFIFPIRLEGKANENVLADIGSDINTMPYQDYETMKRKDEKAARIDVLRTAKSDSDDEEHYQITRNKFGAPIYGPKPAPYLNCNDQADRSLALQAVTNLFRKISVWKKALSFLVSLPIPLKQVNQKHAYKGCYTKEEEAK
nr:hypothetical protein [Tanacetum cinerariifolium]